jgi:hypothetical protein
MNKSFSLLLGLGGLGLLAYVILGRKPSGKDPISNGTGTGTAKPPGMFGLGGWQVPAISFKPGSKSEAVAGAVGSSVNSFGALAKQLWTPNKSVATRGGGRSDSAYDPGPVEPTSSQINSGDYVAGDVSPNYGEPGSPGPSSDVAYDYGDSFAF